MSQITVVGTGYTGKRILERVPLARGISRSKPEGVRASRLQYVDLDDEVNTIDAPGAIIYTVPPPDAGRDYRLARLLAALKSPPERFVYLSTTGVYGDRQGETVLETDPVNPRTGRAKRRVAAEQQLTAYTKDHDVELVILRVPGIYGPGRLMLDRIRARQPVIAEVEAGPGNRIHVDDLVTCCIAATTAPPGIYNLGDGDTRSSTWFSSELARQTDVEPPPQVSIDEAGRTFSALRMSFLEESRIVDTTKMRKVLGVTPKFTNPEDGIRASLADEEHTARPQTD